MFHLTNSFNIWMKNLLMNSQKLILKNKIDHFINDSDHLATN